MPKSMEKVQMRSTCGELLVVPNNGATLSRVCALALTVGEGPISKRAFIFALEIFERIAKKHLLLVQLPEPVISSLKSNWLPP